MIFQIVITIICLIRCAITSEFSTSMYERDSWNKTKNKWPAELYINGKNPKSSFDNEFNVEKKLTTLCDKIESLPQNTANHDIANQQKNDKPSQYKGVSWHRQSRKWCVFVRLKDKKIKYGGTFNDELDAAKRVNQLCEDLGITPKNSAISAIPNQQYQAKEKTSQYKGVSYDKQTGKWLARFHFKGQTPKYGGQFNDEQDAAKKVNQICKGFGIPLQNPGINGMPNQQHETKEKASQHKGVTYDKGTGKWRARCQLKGQTPTYGGVFEDELHAAIKVNELCKDFGIPEYNPTISAIPNHEYQKKEKTSQYKGVTWQKETGNWSVLMSRKGGKKEYGVFKNELDAAKMKREKKSQYKGVHWNAHCEKWGVRLYMKEKKNENMEECSKMSWMQQRERIKFVKN